jgi:hypothetical protein
MTLQDEPSICDGQLKKAGVGLLVVLGLKTKRGTPEDTVEDRRRVKDNLNNNRNNMWESRISSLLYTFSLVSQFPSLLPDACR